MSESFVPLIICHDVETRLWSGLAEVRPKHFPLFGARSIFQIAPLRVSDGKLFERPIIVATAAYRFMVLKQLARIGLGG